MSAEIPASQQLTQVVVDTNVVSYVFRRDTRAALYQPYLDRSQAVISFMTLAELESWALRRNWGEARIHQLRRFLSRFIIRHSDAALCERWATTTAAALRAGRPMSSADAWIAATALHYGIPLVTHNPADFTCLSDLVVITEASP